MAVRIDSKKHSVPFRFLNIVYKNFNVVTEPQAVLSYKLVTKFLRVVFLFRRILTRLSQQQTFFSPREAFQHSVLIVCLRIRAALNCWHFQYHASVSNENVRCTHVN